MNAFESADVIGQEQGAPPGEQPVATQARCLIGPDNQPYLKVNKAGHVVIRDASSGAWVQLVPSLVGGAEVINLNPDQA